jgi:succinate dehydrogenase / fumarate reductase, membrane anchor subunit
MILRSSLGRARGLGSAKSGVNHYWLQHLAAVGLVPLMLWFAFSIAHLAGADYATVKAWLGHPLNASLMLLAVISAVGHAVLGVQVVIEDYVHGPFKWFGLIGNRLAGAFLAAFMAVSILKVAFGG